MDLKALAVTQILHQLEDELATLLHAAKAAHDAATHDESKPEDQYDTRGLEASYLASGQARRAEEIRTAIEYFRGLGPTGGDTRLLTVELVDEDEEEGTPRRRSATMGGPQRYLIARLGGGIFTVVEGRKIQVITPDSPMGEQLLDRKVGDKIEVELRNATREYRVVATG